MIITEISTQFDIWLDKLQDRISSTDMEVIKKAYRVASAAHEGQTRVSGEPYITHSLEVAKILSELVSDVEAIAAALLHDVPEDTKVTIDEIQAEFGATVSNLVDGVTKLTEVENFDHRKHLLRMQSRKEFERAESLRKMFLAMGEDVRVVIIKLADRLHNMRTLQSMPTHKRERISTETLEIFAPLASRLGIYQIKCELENLSFKYLNETKYYQIAEYVSQGQTNRNNYVAQIAAGLEELLQKSDIEADLQWRTKHFYSIYRKMMSKRVDLDHIYDVTALRVIVDDVKDCYAALGIIHTNWRPIPGQFDDYIAAPKENGYQSLHTCVMDTHGERFEVQIRTKNMDYSAEYGIAAHWRYKDGSHPDDALDQKIAAMRQTMIWQQDMIIGANEVEDAREFVDGLKSDIIEERVYVFTPDGDILNLPLGSTPIDFAYKIHTEVGNKCRGAKVNGKLVGLNYQLGNGDKIEILIAKRGGPSRDWLNENLGYIKTSRARSKIRYWFKRQNFEDSISQGRTILEREFKRLNLIDLKTDDVATACGYDKTDDFLAAVGFNDIVIQNVVRKALELVTTTEVVEEKLVISTPPATQPSPTDNIHVKGMGNLLTQLANCCHPVPGDTIIGYITRGRGVTVHRYDCPNVLKVTDRERIIDVDWGSKVNETHAVDIIIRAFDRPGLIRDISQVIANDLINIRRLDVITLRKNNTAELLLTLEVPDLQHLIRLMDKIEQLPNIIYLKRKGQTRHA